MESKFNEAGFLALAAKFEGWSQWFDERHDAGKGMVNIINQKRKKVAEGTGTEGTGKVGKGGGRGRKAARTQQ